MFDWSFFNPVTLCITTKSMISLLPLGCYHFYDMVEYGRLGCVFIINGRLSFSMGYLVSVPFFLFFLLTIPVLRQDGHVPTPYVR